MRFTSAILGLLLPVFMVHGVQADSDKAVIVKGEVIEVNFGPMFVDGDGIIKIKSAEGKVITVLIPSGEGVRPKAAGLDDVHDIKRGDIIEARGEAFENRDGAIRPFGASDYVQIVTP